MTTEAEVIVLGGGVAGLAAAVELSQADRRVLLLEARERLGGRVHTQQEPGLLPIELGAEFVHGRPAEIWELLRGAQAPVEFTGRDHYAGHKLAAWHVFTKVEALLAEMKRQEPDRSFLDFLKQRPHVDEEAKRWALRYVRGFHAARPEEISVNSLVQDMQADEAIEGDRVFRIPAGYDALARTLQENCQPQNLTVHLSTPAETVRWRPGEVEVRARSASGDRVSFLGGCALITLPLGVLQAAPGSRGAVAFVPALEQKQRALGQLAMGKVIRVTLRFRERFWEKRDGPQLARLRFLFSDDETFPAWWTSARAPAALLTGWAPGECAEALSGRTEAQIVQQALEALARILKLPTSRLQALLEKGYAHDWQSDPWARGAYSYVKVGGENAPRELAEPVANTLFFAGEATHYQGQHGTVHGAIASGRRAAREILQTRVGERRV
jgi:monoamine oxidase